MSASLFSFVDTPVRRHRASHQDSSPGPDLSEGPRAVLSRNDILGTGLRLVLDVCKTLFAPLLVMF
jgi:hypothetical protein